jgi:hypothetical protein
MIRSSAGSGGGHPGAALHTGFGALGETPNPAAILRADSQRTIRRRLTSLVLMIAALQERAIDAIISDMMVNRDREQLVDFTDIYRNVENRFVARRHASLDISPEGLAGKKLGVKRNTVHDRYITDEYGATAIIRRYSGVAELFVDLALGRNDAILARSPRRASASCKLRWVRTTSLSAPRSATSDGSAPGSGLPFARVITRVARR